MGAIVLILASLIFIVNAAFLLGKIKQTQTVGTANAVVGVLIMTVSILNGVAATNAGGLINAGLGMSFSLFYLMLAWDLLKDYELTGLGWYCLGAGLYSCLATYFYFSVGDMWFTIFGISWAILFFVSFGSMGLGKAWSKVVGWLLAVESITTLLIPGFLLVIGKW
jgi:hypothetical protein